MVSSESGTWELTATKFPPAWGGNLLEKHKKTHELELELEKEIIWILKDFEYSSPSPIPSYIYNKLNSPLTSHRSGSVSTCFICWPRWCSVELFFNLSRAMVNNCSTAIY